MNKRPAVYRQYDPRWADKPYRVPGEEATIRGSGCGPTCAAMLIETLTGRKYTPEDACRWSVEHGYKALRQGTAYAYFKPQFAAFGISCNQLSWINTYGKPEHPNHALALDMLRQGYYLIALMGKGLWTGGGHYVVVWWADGRIHINDPASAKKNRQEGDPETFRSQVKYYWWVDAREYNRGEEEEEMKVYQYVKDMPQWAREAATKAIRNGYMKMDETGAVAVWECSLQPLVWMDRAGLLDKKE